MINPDYKSGKSLHEQIEDEIKRLIINGHLKADEQLPSVRELSISLTVNPNTVQRAYKQLEQDGFIYSIKGKGNFVSQQTAQGSRKHADELLDALSLAVKELCFLGEDKKTLYAVIDKAYADREGSL